MTVSMTYASPTNTPFTTAHKLPAQPSPVATKTAYNNNDNGRNAVFDEVEEETYGDQHRFQKLDNEPKTMLERLKAQNVVRQKLFKTHVFLLGFEVSAHVTVCRICLTCCVFCANDIYWKVRIFRCSSVANMYSASQHLSQ